jgi:hypothetical protein
MTLLLLVAWVLPPAAIVAPTIRVVSLVAVAIMAKIL